MDPLNLQTSMWSFPMAWTSTQTCRTFDFQSCALFKKSLSSREYIAHVTRELDPWPSTKSTWGHGSRHIKPNIWLCLFSSGQINSCSSFAKMKLKQLRCWHDDINCGTERAAHSAWYAPTTDSTSACHGIGDICSCLMVGQWTRRSLSN